MNRADRRKAGIKTKEQTYVLTRSQIEQMKKDCVKDAVDSAMVLMFGLPVMVIHDHWSELTKRSKISKEERFTDILIRLYKHFDNDDFTLDDVREVLEKECGIKINERM